MTLKLNDALIGQVVIVSVAETRHEAMEPVSRPNDVGF
jgi:hypothetical protein